MAIIKTAIETITPEIAKAYLEHNTTNRNPNKNQVAYYARMMSEGKWVLNGESIIFDSEGNLIDGQHRLMAVVLANTPIQAIVVRDVEHEAFITIDRGKTRSISDAFSIKGISNSHRVSSIIRRFIIMNRMNTLGSLGSLQTTGGTEKTGKNKVSIQETLEEYNLRPEFWQEENSFASSCCSRFNILSGTEIATVSSYLQLTKGYSAEVVHNFFKQIFFEEHTKNKTLALFRRMAINDAMKERGRMTSLYKTQILVKSWEAYKKNIEYKVLRWNREVEGVRTFD